MPSMLKERAGRIAAVALLASGNAQAEYSLNFPPPASSGAREIYDIHMLTLAIATVLMIVVTAVVGYSVWAHRKSRGFEPDASFHETWFGHWGWIAVPLLVLGVDLAIAGSAQNTLARLWNPPAGVEMLDVKVTGHQWWWQYDYIDSGVTVESRAATAEQAGDRYLREVDHPLVLPIGRPVRFLHTSADVLHAFWVPALGFKKDAIPGYVTETWAVIDEPGLYRGQCAELCGTWHSRMPVVVKAVAQDEFDAWVAERQAAAETARAEAAADREWEPAELMARGKETYQTKCATCHQPSGEGLPPAFPPLKGSKVVLGPVEGHIDVVLHGRPGTAMQPWAQLSDLEIAALITYERNAWGNDTGDVIQPQAVAMERAGTRSASN